MRNEFNIKHQYQVGAPAIWWFVGEFLSGKTHDPVSVFRATRDAYLAGCDPVVCISQNYDFGGAPHCILPVGWDDSTTPWRMLVHDPNFPSLTSGDPGPRILTSIQTTTHTATTAAATNTTAAPGPVAVSTTCLSIC